MPLFCMLVFDLSRGIAFVFPAGWQRRAGQGWEKWGGRGSKDGGTEEAHARTLTFGLAGEGSELQATNILWTALLTAGLSHTVENFAELPCACFRQIITSPQLTFCFPLEPLGSPPLHSSSWESGLLLIMETHVKRIHILLN